MTRFAIAAAMCFALPTAAFAGAKCKPIRRPMNEADAKAKLVAQGYKIDKLKVDGNCYEIYVSDKGGKKVEIYFDTKTREVVKSEIKG